MSPIPADTETDADAAKANAVRDRANSLGIQRHWRDPYFDGFDGSELDALAVFDYNTAPKRTKFVIILCLTNCILFPTAITYSLSQGDRFWTLFVAICLLLYFGPMICCILPVMPPHTAVTARGVVHAIGWANERPSRLYEFSYDAILDVKLRVQRNQKGDTYRSIYLTIAQPSTTYLKIWRDPFCYCMLCQGPHEELPNGHYRIHLGFFREFKIFKQLVLEFKRVSAITCSMDSMPNPDLNPDFAPLDDEEC